jgi:two-component system alkaline phosphatase synthesis response regulator PhoP
MPKILVIEDDENIRMALEDDLSLEGYQVISAEEGQQGFAMAKENQADLIILDIMLPKMSGFDVCRELRQVGITTPILMLTAKSQEIDKVLGLEIGADDYVTKPFSPRELIARIKALLRRSKQNETNETLVSFGDIEIDFTKYEAKKGGRLVHLTAYEFAMLHLFFEHQDKVLTRDFILDEIWGKDIYVTPRTVDTHMANLRKKIEDNPAEPKFIVGIRGVGYKFRA